MASGTATATVVRVVERWRIARIAATVAACASLFVWGAALPPFHTGLWFMTEPQEIALWASGALAAIVLAWHPGAREAMRSPLVLIPLALAGLTLVTSLAQPFPVRSWFGPPQTGEGGFWFLTLGLQVALFRLADRVWAARVALGSAAAVVGITMDGQPLNSFTDYLAFVGIALAIIHPGWFGMLWCAGLVIASGSKGAMMLTPFMVAMALVVGRDRLPRAIVAGIAPLYAMVGILALAEWMPSAWSRLLLWRISVEGMIAEPMTWLVGHGWGGYNDMLLRHRALAVALDPTWEGAWWRGAWHSHNAPIEALLSVGIVGLVLVIALYALAAARSDRIGAGLWAAMAGLAAIWPPIPCVVPFIALALAVTSERR